MVPAEAAAEKKSGLVGFQLLSATMMGIHTFHLSGLQT